MYPGLIFDIDSFGDVFRANHNYSEEESQSGNRELLWSRNNIEHSELHEVVQRQCHASGSARQLPRQRDSVQRVSGKLRRDEPTVHKHVLIAGMNNNQYHSLEAQVTMRPTRGVTMQGSYTWSRNNGLSGDARLGNS